MNSLEALPQDCESSTALRDDRGNGIVVGVDVGGTFTDCIVVDPRSRQVRVAKVPSTPHDQAEGLVQAVDRAWNRGAWNFEA